MLGLMTTATASRSPTRQAWGFLAWLALVLVAAAVGAVASADARTFYAELTLPAWAPPGWIFGPAWSLLYLLMAVSVWLVWRSHGWRGARAGLALFVTQLACNALWSWLFFAWHRGAAAFAEVVLLWGLIAATVTGFRRLHRFAAALLLPYLAWVTYAAALTYAVWQANPTLL